VALKNYKNSNFTSLTNHFRVDAAIAMMDDTACKYLKIEGIAKVFWFGSKSNFYNVFENYTLVKPTFYRSFISNQKGIRQ